MTLLNKINDMLDKFKKKYRLTKEDSTITRNLLIKFLSSKKNWELGMYYVIEFPEEVGVEAYLYTYKLLNTRSKKRLLNCLVDNKTFINNKNFKTIKRIGFLINRMYNENLKKENINFLLKNINQLILTQTNNDLEIDSYQDLLKIFTLEYKVNNLKNKLNNKKKVNQQKEIELEEYKEKTHKLTKEKKEIERELEQKKELIKKKNEKINKLLAVNKQKDTASLSQYKNKLAGKLKPDYENIKEISDVEMNEELGEVLRIKINDIYKKLINNGIPLEE